MSYDFFLLFIKVLLKMDKKANYVEREYSHGIF